MLNDRCFYVAGGTGNIGFGIVQALLEEGAYVFVSSRSQEKANLIQNNLKASLRKNLKTILVNIGEEKGVQQILQEILQLKGSLDGVVASLGGVYEERSLVHYSVDSFRKILDSFLMTHFLLAKTFLPYLADRDGSSYTIINGAADYPIPKAGPISMVNAANAMLQEVLATDYEREKVKINTLMITNFVNTPTTENAPSEWVTSSDMGHLVVNLISSPTKGQIIRLAGRDQLGALISKNR